MEPELEQKQTTDEKLIPQLPATNTQGDSNTESANLELSFSITSTSTTVNKSFGKTPSLPKLKAAKISSHRHDANPSLAVNLLHEIEATVTGWQEDLQLTVRKIQDIYLEGPIVDGWLESHPRKPDEGGAEVRKASSDRLMDYVEELSNDGVAYQSPRAGYRLCGLDENGKVWSRPCPPEQVPNVSVAIARYQKLRQLLLHKHNLETRLNELAETLVILHSSIKE
ncbi:MAG: hypothetical protein SAL07_03320 [Oscillatoria sp. PMC 1051.18]|nr:hypothetical protein [Oscillatoria sp. PMC 1050.18]MEC5028920.1 hypothetical protein [Oscillatoria sp. PMC 1051.18]